MSRSFVRGMIIPIDGGGSPVRFQWNPNRIDGPTAGAEWDQVKTAGRAQPWLQFSCGTQPEIAFIIQLSSDQGGRDGSVEQAAEALRKLSRPQKRGQGVPHPPRVELIVGTFLRKTCVLIGVSPVFHKQFDPQTLQPVFGEVSLKLWEYLDA